MAACTYIVVITHMLLNEAKILNRTELLFIVIIYTFVFFYMDVTLKINKVIDKTRITT
jgi:hypothetical protein